MHINIRSYFNYSESLRTATFDEYGEDIIGSLLFRCVLIATDVEANLKKK